MSACEVGGSYSLVTEDRAAVLAALTRGECDGLLPAACGFMDDFAAFIGEAGLLKLFDRFPDHRCRRSIASAFFCNTLLHKALLRFDSLAQIGPVLFHSPDMLRKLGFNFRQINEGFYTGVSQRPFDAEALADYFADIPVEELLLARFDLDELRGRYTGGVRVIAKLGQALRAHHVPARNDGHHALRLATVAKVDSRA